MTNKFLKEEISQVFSKNRLNEAVTKPADDKQKWDNKNKLRIALEDKLDSLGIIGVNFKNDKFEEKENNSKVEDAPYSLFIDKWNYYIEAEYNFTSCYINVEFNITLKDGKQVHNSYVLTGTLKDGKVVWKEHK